MTKSLKILICFTASNRWYGRLIRWATDSEFNHALLKHEDPFWGGWRAIEINEEGPHDQSISKLIRINRIEHWECAIDLLPAIRKMSNFVGSAGYDWVGLLSGLARAIWNKIAKKEIKRVAHSRNRWFCSEFIAAVLKEAKVPGTENFDPPSVSPETLRGLFATSTYFYLVKDPVE